MNTLYSFSMPEDVRTWEARCDHLFQHTDEKWEKCEKCFRYRKRLEWIRSHPNPIRHQKRRLS